MNHTIPSNHDLFLFGEGTLHQSYKTFGAHLVQVGNATGIRFVLWAPNALAVCVVGSFNDWDGSQHIMDNIADQGIWLLYTSDATLGDTYKYKITTATGETLIKADPYAFASEVRPNTASMITNLTEYSWSDEKYLKNRDILNVYKQPINIYEVHLGSWQRDDKGEFLTYRELAATLVPYVKEMGYTHVELLPIMEHPFDGSWGYQITGYYSVTSRFGSPTDFMYFVDCCHQNNIGVILDWVPSHFCKDCHGLRLFDGSPVYEYEDELKADKGEWGTLSFDFGKNQVQSFLISNALFWMELFHIDGLRVDAVASMLYLDFGKDRGKWTPNQYGGRENIEAIQFLRNLNEAVFKHYPSALMMAEESTSWPLVSAPTYLGGLGFNYKWNMGWMNDTLKYMEFDSVHKKWHHDKLTFSFFYAFSENFLLPLSHDEVVHGKKSLLNKMPGDYWQKFANLRVFLGYLMTHPGKKLVFMGGEFGQFIEWNENQQLDWFLLDYDAHRQTHLYVKEINHFYKENKILWELDHQEAGFSWIDPHNHDQSIISFMRYAENGEYYIILCNFTPVVHHTYRIGVPDLTEYREVFNSDLSQYGGSNLTNKNVQVIDVPWNNQVYSIEITVPPLAISILKPVNIERSVSLCKKSNA